MKKFQSLLTVASYALAFLGFLSLALAINYSFVIWIAVFGAGVTGFYIDKTKKNLKIYDLLWNVAIVLYLIYFFVQIFYIRSPFAESVAGLLIVILLNKLSRKRERRDYAHLYLVSFFQLLVAGMLNSNLSFAFLFVVYCLVALWVLLLFHLHGQSELANIHDLGLPKRVNARIVLSVTILTSLIVLSLSIVVVFIIIPRTDFRLLIRKVSGGVLSSGFSEKVEIGSFGTIKTDKRVVMRVSIPALKVNLSDRLRWRGVALDYYDANSWSRSFVSRYELPRNKNGFGYIINEVSPGLLFQKIELEPIGSEVLFAAERPLEFQGDFKSVSIDFTGSFYLPTPPLNQIVYTAYSTLAEPSSAKLKAVKMNYPKAVTTIYLQLPETSEKIFDLARSITKDAGNPYDKAKSLEQFLQHNFNYKLGIGKKPVVEPLENFLFNTRSGHCEYFATSMAVLLRCIGIPARVVNGFRGGEWNEFGRFYSVRQSDAHSWVEAYFPGYGWIPFDPTPFVHDKGGWFAIALFRRYGDYLQAKWNHYVVTYNQKDQLRLASAIHQRAIKLADALANHFRLAIDETRFIVKNLSGRLIAASFVLFLFGLFIVLISKKLLGKRWVTLPKAKRYKGSERIVILYLEALKALSKKGFVKAPQVTPREFSKNLSSAGVIQMFPFLEDLTEAYYEVRYGDLKVKDERLERFKDDIRKLRKSKL